MESQHMTQKVFAQFTGISEGSLSGVFNGHTRPTLQMVDLIHQRFPNISTDWLMYGQGPMYRDQVEDKTEGEQAETNASLNAAVVQTSSPLLFSSDDIISTSKMESRAGNSIKETAGTITKAQLKEIAETKLPDLNAGSVEAAMNTIAGTARSMGIKITD